VSNHDPYSDRQLRPAVTVGDSVATVYFTPTILELTLNS